MSSRDDTSGRKAGPSRKSSRHHRRIGARERLRLFCADVQQNHCELVFVIAILATSVCYAVLPGEDSGSVLAQSIVLALIGVVAAGFSREGAIRLPEREGEGSRQEVPTAEARLAKRWGLYLLGVGLVGGIVDVAFAAMGLAGGKASDVVVVFDGSYLALMLLGLVTFLMTGIFEEGVFRVSAISAFEMAFGDKPHASLRAAIVSALLFGLMHVSSGDAESAQDLVSILQFVLKPVQAAMFGFCLAVVYQTARNLWAIAGFHALFDLLYLGPAMLLTGTLQNTYVTGLVGDLVVLVVTTILLIPATRSSYRWLSAIDEWDSDEDD